MSVMSDSVAPAGADCFLWSATGGLHHRLMCEHPSGIPCLDRPYPMNLFDDDICEARIGADGRRVE
jgi:hypothetical protein